MTAELRTGTDPGVGTPVADVGTTSGVAADAEPLLAPEVHAELWERWERIQAAFVDEPRRSLAEADILVLDVIEQVTRGFRDARSALEHEWQHDGDVSTEELRRLLRRYRAFFGRLLDAT